jgi:hypothetical protein
MMLSAIQTAIEFSLKRINWIRNISPYRYHIHTFLAWMAVLLIDQRFTNLDVFQVYRGHVNNVLEDRYRYDWQNTLLGGDNTKKLQSIAPINGTIQWFQKISTHIRMPSPDYTQKMIKLSLSMKGAGDQMSRWYNEAGTTTTVNEEVQSMLQDNTFQTRRYAAVLDRLIVMGHDDAGDSHTTTTTQQPVVNICEVDGFSSDKIGSATAAHFLANAQLEGQLGGVLLRLRFECFGKTSCGSKPNGTVSHPLQHANDLGECGKCQVRCRRHFSWRPKYH